MSCTSHPQRCRTKLSCGGKCKRLWVAVVEGLDEFEGGDDDEDDGGDIVLDEEYSSMVQEMDNVVFTLDKADDNALN